MSNSLASLRARIRSMFDVPDDTAPERYRMLRRNLTLVMTVVSVLPLLILTWLSYHQYHTTITREVVAPTRTMVNKTRHSFELFLAERTATVSLVARTYSLTQLSNTNELSRIFLALKNEIPGFVDLGVINAQGEQLSYVGPYDLQHKNYAQTEWFHQAQVKGVFISGVFMGFRRFPHIVIAVQHISEDSKPWILRATIETEQFDRLIAAMGLAPESDAFLIDSKGTLQTDSRFYGQVLDTLPLPVPHMSYDASLADTTDPQGREVYISSAFLQNADFAIMAVQPKNGILEPWTSLRSDLLLFVVASIALIITAASKLTGILVKRIQASDERRIAAFMQIEHTQKLSSIGRLAAGVAHEINNPLAIINEKAGLASDLLELSEAFPQQERFLKLIGSIQKSVDRCRSITHRLLGFSRREENSFTELDINSVLTETLGFLEQEAVHRSITTTTSLDSNLPEIVSDQGQLQQVFLNILNNAFAAVQDGGAVSLTTFQAEDSIGITIQDDGKGMSDEVVKHIFEPFFTTKKANGTGLGMFITYSIIKKLGGEITVKSKEGSGTTITIFLPKHPPMTTTAGEPNHAA